MELGLHPGIIFALAIALFLALHLALRAPLPLAFLLVAVATALLGDFGIPFRHLVEGGFGFINLVLALFAGAFFGHMMRASGAADAAAATPAPSIASASPSIEYSSSPLRPSERALWPSGNCNGSTPIPTRFERWMRSKLSAMTARTPSSLVPFAAQSREEPEPYSLPASTTRSVPVRM